MVDILDRGRKVRSVSRRVGTSKQTGDVGVRREGRDLSPSGNRQSTLLHDCCQLEDGRPRPFPSLHLFANTT